MLVVKLSSLGDLFHPLPAVRALKEQLGVEVDWVTQHRFVDLVRRFTDVERVIGFPRTATLQRLPRFLAEVRLERYGLVLDFQGLFKSAVVARLARSARRIGPSFSREGAPLFYHAVAGTRDRDRHAVMEAMDFVRHLDLAEPAAPVFPVDFPAFAVEGDRPRVALAPCSRWVTKNWPPGHFIEVGRRLQEACGATLYLVGGPQDRQECAQIADALPDARNLCARTSLPELGGLLAAMDLAVTVDTGPMHVAAAAGTPVLAVFGATDPRRTGPFGRDHRVLTTEGPDCRPCRARHCRRHDLACLQELDPGRVAAAALAMLGHAKA